MTATAVDKFTRYKPRKSAIRASQPRGQPIHVNTEQGTETVYDTQYVVEVGVLERNKIVPPRDGKPGTTIVTPEPLLEVMDAADFESLYEPA